MLSRSVNILLYFHLVIESTVNETVVKGTPREGHPLKEGFYITIRRKIKRINSSQHFTTYNCCKI